MATNQQIYRAYLEGFAIARQAFPQVNPQLYPALSDEEMAGFALGVANGGPSANGLRGAAAVIAVVREDMKTIAEPKPPTS